ncbi:thermonuclease family protein [Microcoleus sp. LAD1_D5]|uniref:thermonuclease family protein n=1 Tax=Microcoleus sp. LAD1_D5 TaxID=2818813 RepID=UPI002FCF2969
MKFIFKLIPFLIPIALFVFLFSPKSDPAVDAQSQGCNLIRISDGDSIVCSMSIEQIQDGVTEQIQNEEKIRFCGIDAPEMSQPLGRESKQKLTDFLQGKEIIISPIERDRYGRLVAEVFVKISQQSEEELFINAEMVRSGMAYHYAQYSDSCWGRLEIEDAENQARSRSIGVWNGTNEKPWDYRRRTN